MSNPPKSRRKPGARQYSDYSQEMLNVAVDLVTCKKISSYEAEKQFGIPRRTILNKCKNLHVKSVGHPTKLSAEEEKHKAEVVNLSAEFGCPLSMIDFRIVLHDYLEKNDRLQVFNGKMPGERWVRSFMARHNFTQRATQNIKRCRAEKSVSEMIEFYKNLESSLLSISPQNILNFDETNLSDDPGTTKAIFKRGTKHPERVVNSTKTSVSIMFAGTATGQCLPPYVIYKSDHLWARWCRDGPPNARYNRTKSGWFDMNVFDDWFESVVLPWANDLNGTKLVIGDNLSSHLSVSTIKLCLENDIKFVFLPKNTTHLTQPLDLAFFRPLKREWRKILLQYKLSNPSVSSLNKCHFPQLLKELLEKIELNNNENLKSGFLAAGIYPLNPSKVTDKIPNTTEKKEEKFDTALLDFLQTSRQSKPLKSGKNQKYQITPGKSLSTEDAEIISIKKVKPTKVKAKNVANSEINYNNILAAPLSENDSITQISENNSKMKKSKVTLLSDIKFSTLNTPFRCLENTPLQLTEIDKNTDLFHTSTLNQPSDTKSLIDENSECNSNHHQPNKIVTLVNVHCTLSSTDEENNINTGNIVKPQKKNKLVKRIKKVAKKESHHSKVKQKRNFWSNVLLSTSDSEIEMSIHSDSDLMDIDVIPMLECDDENDERIETTIEKPQLFPIADDDETIMNENDNKVEKIKNNDVQKSEWTEAGQINDQILLKTRDREVQHDHEACNTKFDVTEKDLLKKKTDFEVNNESCVKDSYNIGETVLIRYYKTKSWKYYIGEIESISPAKFYTISVYKTIGIKTGTLKFIMSKRNTDKDIVPEDSIVKAIEMLQISENPNSYVLMEDHDQVYFLK